MTPDMDQELSRLIDNPEALDRLAAFLVAHSNLPGPRGNLELLDCFAILAATRPALLPVLLDWLRRETAPGDPAEFLSATAATALGALHGDAPAPMRETIERALRAAANDPRWRVRESVAMGLQRIGERGGSELLELLRTWLHGTPLERRAVVAALAHPPILAMPAITAEALALGETVARSIAASTADERKTEKFKVLKQGLSYALSVLVAAAPAEGFPMLDRLVATGDRELRAIIVANLGKARLSKRFPDEVARLLASMPRGRDRSGSQIPLPE